MISDNQSLINICVNCKQIFKSKYLLNKHLNRKNPCSINDTKSIININSNLNTNGNSININANKNNYDVLNKQISNLKIENKNIMYKYEKEIFELINKNKECMGELSSEIKTIEDKYEKEIIDNPIIKDLNAKIANFDDINIENIYKIEKLKEKLNKSSNQINALKHDLKLIHDEILGNDLNTYNIEINDYLTLTIKYEECKSKKNIKFFGNHLKDILNDLFVDNECCENYLSIVLKILTSNDNDNDNNNNNNNNDSNSDSDNDNNENNNGNKLIDIDTYFYYSKQTFVKWTSTTSSNLEVLILSDCKSDIDYYIKKIRKQKMINGAEQINDCVICLTNKYNVVMIPCCHISCCSECAKSINDFCPVCRAKIKSKYTIHFS